MYDVTDEERRDARVARDTAIIDRYVQLRVIYPSRSNRVSIPSIVLSTLMQEFTVSRRTVQRAVEQHRASGKMTNMLTNTQQRAIIDV